MIAKTFSLRVIYSTMMYPLGWGLCYKYYAVSMISETKGRSTEYIDNWERESAYLYVLLNEDKDAILKVIDEILESLREHQEDHPKI
jgi:hypothetical protein